jgi:hypothetical protein
MSASARQTVGRCPRVRQRTRIVGFELVPSVVSFLLKDPLEFFQNDEAHEALAGDGASK